MRNSLHADNKHLVAEIAHQIQQERTAFANIHELMNFASREPSSDGNVLPAEVRWYPRDVPYLSGNDRRTQLTEIPAEDLEPLDDIYDLDAYVLGIQGDVTEEYAESRDEPGRAGPDRFLF